MESKNGNIETNLKDLLKCMICHDMATIPVHLNCCENSKGNPGCLLCVRKYLRLNERRKNTDGHFKKVNKLSFTGCGCKIDVSEPGSSIYRHSKELWAIRDLFGKSVCQHEGCKQEFNTTAELLRHLNGDIKVHDKFEACLEANTKCTMCNYYGKRGEVNGEHYDKYHAFHCCELCNKCVRIRYLKKHYEHHKKQHNEYGKSLKQLEDNVKKILGE